MSYVFFKYRLLATSLQKRNTKFFKMALLGYFYEVIMHNMLYYIIILKHKRKLILFLILYNYLSLVAPNYFAYIICN